MLNRKSIRKYKSDMPTDEIIQAIVRSGQQAPFAYQCYSILLDRKNKHPFGAPLQFTICVDLHKLEMIMKKRNWTIVINDLSMLIMGIQDAAYTAGNMVMAAESLGLGSCFIGATPYYAKKIVEEYKLPNKVFPLVQLVMGYPAEDPTPRPRYPMEYCLFEDQYPEFTDEMIDNAIAEMDEGYINQNYYRDMNNMIPIKDGSKELYTFDNYGWTEHISRKAGQWLESPEELLEQFEACGFNIRYESAKND
ncbi:nitroreductase family protein [Clostridium sp. D2Q-11]|uniref:Nitroreductase family protein n=1 Tax=Anaeromonas frigoriresistens TaxID=2683708 RepID=A0A942UY46_9FIRM|nr:nitroreductase family protein [Anaeromonas frigoriresistens]MBS4538954.1 nitroreductase family protein [Anaeromonas frigoriresistens]